MKKTRKQREAQGEIKPSGQSKYALKIARRKREAIKIGLRPNATWPEIWLNR